MPARFAKASRVQVGASGQVLLLNHPLHSEHPNAMRSLIVWMYTERLEVGLWFLIK